MNQAILAWSSLIFCRQIAKTTKPILLDSLHINTAIYDFSKFKFEVQFLSWVLFEVESFSKLNRSKLGLSKLSPFRSWVLIEVESFEVQSFEVGSFEVQLYKVRSFEVQSFEVQSMNPCRLSTQIEFMQKKASTAIVSQLDNRFFLELSFTRGGYQRRQSTSASNPAMLS